MTQIRPIRNITLGEAKILHAAVDAAMEEIAKTFDLTFERARALCDREGTLFKTSVVLKIKTTAGGKSLAQVEFERNAELFGLVSEDFGAIFTSRGRQFRVTGLAMNRRKFPIRTECLADGKTYDFAETVAETIKRAKAVAK